MSRVIIPRAVIVLGLLISLAFDSWAAWLWLHTTWPMWGRLSVLLLFVLAALVFIVCAREAYREHRT